MFGKPQKQVFRTVSPTLAASLEPLALLRNVASQQNYFDVHLNCGRIVSIPYSCRRFTLCSDIFDDFYVLFPRWYNYVYINSFFPRTARLWNSLFAECFPFTYDLKGFQSRVGRHLSSLFGFLS